MTSTAPNQDRRLVARCPANGVARIERPANIVIVEDDLRIARRVARLVSQEAHAVRIAPMCLPGLSFAGARPPRVSSTLERERRLLWADVVVVDLGEPDESRMDAFLAMAKNHPNVPFVLCAEDLDDARVERAIEAGHLAIAKPFSSIEIRAAVEEAAHRRRGDEASEEAA